MKGYTEIFVKRVSTSLSKLTAAIAVVGLGACLSACSVEATSPAPSNPFGGGVPTTQTAAKAMAIEGTWTTDCYYDNGAYNLLTMRFSDNSIAITADGYYSSTCTGSKLFNAKFDATMNRVGGSFYVIGGHDVEVVTIENGVPKTQRTVFLPESGLLYMSDGDKTTPGQWPSSVDRSRPYHKIGG